MPRTLQARLSLAFAMVIALTLGLVSIFVLNRLDDYFTRQQRTDLEERHAIVAAFVRGATRTAAGDHLVVLPDGTVNPAVLRTFNNDEIRKLIADQTAQANVIVRFGLTTGIRRRYQVRAGRRWHGRPAPRSATAARADPRADTGRRPGHGWS
jgi:hypothetical protein